MRSVIGCMTGTSIDALDVSLVEIEGHGLSMGARHVRSLTRELGDCAPRLRALAEQQPMTARDIAALARDFASLHAAAIAELLGTDRADLICVHGQTVFHAPPLSWQLMQPAPIARALNCPVVYDLRQADLAAGGQGAPITPIADWVLFHHHADPMTVINLGGFANFSQWFTDWPDDTPKPEWRGFDVRGGDICACNQLLDGLARLRLGRPYDIDGRVARAGTIDDRAYAFFRDRLQAQSRLGRSLGTGDELAEQIRPFESVSSPALLMSACEAVAGVIAERMSLKAFPASVAGGGIKNAALMGALSDRARHPILTTEEAGIPPEYREAICFAVLGALCQDKVPITIPGVTGVATAPLSGAWVYP